MAVYSAAKAYVRRLGEALHREFKRENVTVTTQCPGLSETVLRTTGEQNGQFYFLAVATQKYW